MLQLITTSELAESRGLTPSAISRQVSEGRLTPAYQLPGLRGAFLFLPEDAEPEH
ncbi:hypothetical protein [Cryobacterium sp. Y62]|uniref:hypothetical protein n=1 Tax=Cryobacterium sp. Y62 TaxID=2048284 RepID=UPI0011B0096A|nr:hypothetical protein [Cryobacterium sp. Y62]